MYAKRKHFNNGGKRGRKVNPTKVLISMRQPPQKTARLSERRIVAYTTRKTVNRLARKQLQLNLCSAEQPKGEINLT